MTRIEEKLTRAEAKRLELAEKARAFNAKVLEKIEGAALNLQDDQKS